MDSPRVPWGVRGLLTSMMAALQLAVVTITAAPAAHFVPSLPGQPHNVTFNQYAGYVTVDRSEGRKLFYYFVEAETSSSTKPLVLWLNGGPGCSSLIGAFTELGPFYPHAAGNGLNVNGDSWNQVANVIFLENPAGVGFSYAGSNSDGYSTDDERTAQDALAFLLGWLAEYPEYQSTDFYITGESYAGHYAPQLAAAIIQNNKVSGQIPIRLEGIMVGNPLFDALIDLEYAPFEFGWGHGMVSDDVHDTILRECDYTAPNWSQACVAAKDTARLQMGKTGNYINAYDVTADVCLKQGPQAMRLKAMATRKSSLVDPCIGNELIEYLNYPDVQRALHAEVHDWQECFKFYNQSNIFTPMSPILTELFDANDLRVWIYNGDLDTVVSFIGTRKILQTLVHQLKRTTTSDYQLWFQGSQVGGWTISWGSVVYATVRGASHMVPATQPARALVLFSSFLAGDKSPPLQPT